MKSSRERYISILCALVGNEQSRITEANYNFYLIKDEWEETEVIQLFTTDREKVRHLYDLIESSRNAKKLKPSRVGRLPYPSQESIYYYDPFTIIHWALAKEIPLPDKLIEWHDQQVKLKQVAATQLESEQTNQPGTDASAQNEEMPVKENDLTYVLRILLGMAIDGYKYDPDANKNAATGSNHESIRSALQRCGLDADNKTIREFLREAARQNPDARPRKT